MQKSTTASWKKLSSWVQVRQESGPPCLQSQESTPKPSDIPEDSVEQQQSLKSEKLGFWITFQLCELILGVT